MLQWHAFCHRLHVDCATCTVALVRCTNTLCWQEYLKQDSAPHTPSSCLSSSFFTLWSKLKQEHAASAVRESKLRSNNYRRKKESENKQGDGGKLQCIFQKYLLYHFASVFLLAHPAALQSPAFYCLPAASINYGWYYVCERGCVTEKWGNKQAKRRRRRRSYWMKAPVPNYVFPSFPPHSFPSSSDYFCCYFKYRVVHNYAFLCSVHLFQSNNRLFLHLLYY